MIRGRELRSTCLDVVLVVGLSFLLHLVFVRVPAHLARQEEPSVSVIRLTAPDVAPSIERSVPLAGKRIRGSRMNTPLPAAPEEQ